MNKAWLAKLMLVGVLCGVFFTSNSHAADPNLQYAEALVRRAHDRALHINQNNPNIRFDHKLNHILTELRSVRANLPHLQQKQLLLYMAKKHQFVHGPQKLNANAWLNTKLHYGSAFVMSFFAMELVRFCANPYTSFEESVALLKLIPYYSMRFITFGIGFHTGQAVYDILVKTLTSKLMAQNSGTLFKVLSQNVNLSAAASKIWGKAFLRMTVSLAVGLMFNAMIYSSANPHDGYWVQMFEYTASLLVGNTMFTPLVVEARQYVNSGKILKHVETFARALKVSARYGAQMAKTNPATLFILTWVETILVWDTFPNFVREARNSGKLEGALGWEMHRAQQLLKTGEKLATYPRRDQTKCSPNQSSSAFYTCMNQLLFSDVKQYLNRRSLYLVFKELKELQRDESILDSKQSYASFLGRKGNDFKVINPFVVEKGYIPWERYQKDMRSLMNRYRKFSHGFRKTFKSQSNQWMSDVETALEQVHPINVQIVNDILNAEDSNSSVADILQATQDKVLRKDHILETSVYQSSSSGRDEKTPRDYSVGALLQGEFGKENKDYRANQGLSGQALITRLKHVALDGFGSHRNFNVYQDLKPSELFKAYAYYLSSQETALQQLLENGATQDQCEEYEIMLAQIRRLKTEFLVLLKSWIDEVNIPDDRSFEPANLHLNEPVVINYGGVLNEVGYPGLEKMFEKVRGTGFLGGDTLRDAENFFSNLSKGEWPGLFDYGHSLEDVIHRHSSFSKQLASKSVRLGFFGNVADAPRLKLAKALDVLASKSTNVLYENSHDVNSDAVWLNIAEYVWDVLWINRELDLSNTNYPSIDVYQKQSDQCRNVWQKAFLDVEKVNFMNELRPMFRYLGPLTCHVSGDGCEEEASSGSKALSEESMLSWEIYDTAAMSFQLFSRRQNQSLGISPQYEAQGNVVISQKHFLDLLKHYILTMRSFEETHCF